MTRYLAHFNYARLAHPVDAPEVADFQKGRDPIRRIAEASPGFVWKQEAGAGEGTDTGDPGLLLSLSVWESPAALRHFSWNTLHKRFWLRRAEWFEPHDGPAFVMWWVSPAHTPTYDEAWDRLSHLRDNGDSDAAFGWDWLSDTDAAGEGLPIAAE